MFDPRAHYAALAAAGTLKHSRSAATAIKLTPDEEQLWRTTVALSLELSDAVGDPAILPVGGDIGTPLPAAMADVPEAKVAETLAKTLRSYFALPQVAGGDGTVVWVSVLGADADKGLPLSVRAARAIPKTATTVLPRLVEAGVVDEQGRPKVGTPAPQAS